MTGKILKMLAVFERKQKKKLIGITFLMLIQALLELLGVSIIIPFIDVITQPEILISKPYVSKIVDLFQVGIDGLIVLICLFIIILYIVKNAFLIYLTNVQYKFSYYGQRDLSNRIMKCYLLQDYEFHVMHNSAELIRDISTDTGMFYTTVLSFLQLLSELVICLFLVCYLLLQDALITIAVAISLCLMLLFFMGRYRRVLVKLGNQRRHYSYKMTQSMQQGFGGIKEIKIANREDFFLASFEDANSGFSEAFRKNVFLNAIPKPVMEAVCVTGLMLVIGMKISMGGETQAFISILAVFAVAAFRLLPSVNKVSGYVGNILHNGVVIEEVYNTIKQVEDLEQILKVSRDVREMEFRDKLSVEGLSFKYPGTESCVLEAVSLDIHKNQSVAFVGPSGAGKTTLVDILLGLLPPTEGEVCVDGHDIRDSLFSWRELVGYIPQNIYMLDDTVKNNVIFGLESTSVKDEMVWEALEEAQLADFIRSLPEGLDTMIGEAGVRFSGGQRQRIGIARALFRKPQVLFLDEATSALDNETEAAVMEAIDHLHGRMTIVIIAHRLSTIQKCDVVYEVNGGKVVQIKK